MVEMISIHAPLAGCDVIALAQKEQAKAISIHAPLAGCDRMTDAGCSKVTISIHAPLAGCDRKARPKSKVKHISIHAPLAGCDMTPIPVPIKATNFNPRTPCGVRLACTYNRFGSVEISIHAPLAGCDA